MEIEGPLKISVVETSGDGGWELHIDFRDEFRQLGMAEQATTFRQYLSDVAMGIAGLAESDRDRQGMLLVQQITEQILPHLENGEIALNETIEVEIAQAPVASLRDLIDSSRV